MSNLKQVKGKTISGMLFLLTLFLMVFIFTSCGRYSSDTIADGKSTLNSINTSKPPNSTVKIESVHKDEIEEVKKDKDREIEYDGTIRTAKYIDTAISREMVSNEAIYQYGKYDEYIDDEGNSYTFMYNTDFICSYLSHLGYARGLEKVEITERQALLIADEFIKKNFEPIYSFDSIKYWENDGVYVVIYSYKINGIETQDSCAMWIRANDGIICSFNLSYYKQYIPYKDIQFSEKELREKAEDMLKGNNFEITGNSLIITDNGKLAMCYLAVFTHEDGNQYGDGVYVLIE